MGRTHYEILGVGKDFTPEELKSAYRRLCRTAHPDVGGSDAIFGMVQDAYETLKEPWKRSEYDRSLVGPTSSASEPVSESQQAPNPASGAPSGSEEQRSAPRVSDYWTQPDPEPEVVTDNQAEDLQADSPSFAPSWRLRAVYGVGMVAWILLSQFARGIERALGLEWVEGPGPYFVFLTEPWTVVWWFAIGAFLVIGPWEARRTSKSFPWWEQILLATALAFIIPLGFWWFSDWPQLLAFTALVAGYWLITKLRSSIEVEQPEESADHQAEELQFRQAKEAKFRRFGAFTTFLRAASS